VRPNPHLGASEQNLRDLVALSTLPAIWFGAEPTRIAECLAAALFATSQAQLVFVRLDVGAGERPIVVQTSRHETTPELAESLDLILTDWARKHDPEEVLTLENPGGGGAQLHVTVRPLGLEAKYGLMATGYLDEQAARHVFRHVLANVAATQAAVAVQNIQLLRAVRHHAERLEASEARERLANRDLQTLHEVSRTLSGELDLNRLVQDVTDAARILTGAEFAAFFFNEEVEQRYSLFTLSGAPRSAFEHLGSPRNSKLFAPTFAGAGVVRIDDVRRHEFYGRNPPHNGMPPGHLPVRSYLAVPVKGRSGRVLGCGRSRWRSASHLTRRWRLTMLSCSPRRKKRLKAGSEPRRRKSCLLPSSTIV
jgi:hypothetical protein